LSYDILMLTLTVVKVYVILHQFYKIEAGSNILDQVILNFILNALYIVLLLF